MLLILTNSADETANYLVSRLSDADAPFLRVDTDRIVGKTKIHYSPGQPRIEIGGRWWSPGDFANIWYRRPEVLKADSEEESPESKYAIDEWTDAVEGFLAHIPADKWVNHPVYNSQASKKLDQLSVANELGFQVPATLVTQDQSDLRQFFQKCGENIIIKPLSSGLLKGTSGEDSALIYTTFVGEKDLKNLEDLKDCPSFFQAFISKESDVRITVIDGSITAVRLSAKDSNGAQICDIRIDNMNGVDYEAIALPDDVEEKIRKLIHHYRLRFAAIDMAITTSGDWIFFEVNPNGQWAWLDIFGGQDIGSNFVKTFGGSSSR
jgi:hypothetical protein